MNNTVEIILVGRSSESALLGLKMAKPNRVHLVYTETSERFVEPLAAMIPADTQVSKHLVDPYDVDQIRDLCRQIRSLYDSEDEVFYNLTEGTKIEAFAALEVAKEFDDVAVYFSQEGEVLELNSSHYIRMKVPVWITNEEFARLYGNELASYNLVSEMDPADVATSWQVKQFMEHNQLIVQRLHKQFRSEFGSHLDKLPQSFAVEREKNMYVNINDGCLRIIKGGNELFVSKNPNATRLFFTGRWWEEIVSDVVYRWDKARNEHSQVWRNVEFVGKHSHKTKNELDVMVNDGHRLLFLECKSGYIGQDNIYKIDSTRRTYGGKPSKGFLVSYYPLDEDLIQKCKDLHLYYFAPPTENKRFDYIRQLPAFLDAAMKEFEN